jgi:hypothetical protein
MVEAPIRSLLDLGPKARRVFAALYVAAFVAVVGWGLKAPDHAFGFQMFNETSNLTISLERRVRRGGKRVLSPAPGGVWQARGADGKERTFRWSDHVRDGVLGQLEVRRHASYGLDGQLFRLRQALGYVLEHIPDDTETEALIAVVDASKNGRPPQRVRLTAVRR